ncbi:HupE/UreJ family protein [Falsirhodobacter sp. 20TX0035]|uniref:HupE/UreJ family protein n=1 Tax=Falsirhodobacter sp. 20TX0035 TaxID=3022019 RepID=UPI002330A99F|nr:HupE/UreJ family protein [Falsirhodobacter sp. 20TX0035]MDB6454500.1 HupE/UreJ family protein [Falsirhodobacter sp. 20TX0035]
MTHLLTLALILSPSLALAHAGHDHGSPFQAGLLHPIGGTDHVLAMLAVGLWAAVTGGRALSAMPLAFVAAMVLGGAMGMAGAGLPAVEPMILASVILLGVAAALALRPPLALSLGALAVFGAAHGFAHGAEGPQGQMTAYAAGFVIATAGLHLAGIGAGLAMTRFARILGAAVAAGGFLLAFGG